MAHEIALPLMLTAATTLRSPTTHPSERIGGWRGRQGSVGAFLRLCEGIAGGRGAAAMASRAG
jgi:hypothetical protein